MKTTTNNQEHLSKMERISRNSTSYSIRESLICTQVTGQYMCWQSLSTINQEAKKTNLKKQRKLIFKNRGNDKCYTNLSISKFFSEILSRDVACSLNVLMFS